MMLYVSIILSVWFVAWLYLTWHNTELREVAVRLLMDIADVDEVYENEDDSDDRTALS